RPRRFVVSAQSLVDKTYLLELARSIAKLSGESKFSSIEEFVVTSSKVEGGKSHHDFFDSIPVPSGRLSADGAAELFQAVCFKAQMALYASDEESLLHKTNISYAKQPYYRVKKDLSEIERKLLKKSGSEAVYGLMPREICGMLNDLKGRKVARIKRKAAPVSQLSQDLVSNSIFIGYKGRARSRNNKARAKAV
ncbi:MAG: hypothetical protein OEY44_00950, partial [Candidatus Peregrinibacteria bacterium]|nr:hypothetical protein [Candidatus Peregrinibacteria bacterium]